MDRGSRYLLTSAGRALSTLNARRSLAREGLASIPSFAFGLPPSELPIQHIAAYGASAGLAVLRGVHRTWTGKLGLALTAAAAAGLYRIHRESADAGRIVELALTDELGADYRSRMAPSPRRPTRSDLPLVPTPRVRARYVTDGHITYGDYGRRTTLDVWKRPDLPADAKAPVLVQVHGGAWVTGDKEGQAYPLMTYLVERGWVCVAVTYRLSPRSGWPDHIVDVKRAIGWVKDHIADHGGDPDWVAITGGSAGGHLCSLAALTPNDPQFQPEFEESDTSVQAAVPFYGVYDWTNRDETGRADILEFLEQRIVKDTLVNAREVFEQASSMTHVGPDAVPFMFLHGTNDSLVPVTQARAMVDMVRKVSSNPAVYVEYPGAQHAFDVFASNRTEAAVEGIERFLNVIRGRQGSTT
ncbi:MAG: alpha/beta hydrolase fold domain-containing protein [Acidimicrobiales bacterium]